MSRRASRHTDVDDEHRLWLERQAQWRQQQLEHLGEASLRREEQRADRQLQLEQQMLENARALWRRHVRENQQAVDEAAEKLRNLASLAALLSGSAMAAFLNFSYTDVADNNPVLPWYALASVLTVGLELNACVLCTLMLGSVVKVAKRYASEEEEAEFIMRCQQFALTYRPGDAPPQPRRTFEVHWARRCEGRWHQALLLFLAGIPSFFLNLGTAGYLKFILDPFSYWIVVAIMVLALLHAAHMNWKWSGQLLRPRKAEDDGDGWQGARWLAGHVPEALPFAWHTLPAVASAWPLLPLPPLARPQPQPRQQQQQQQQQSAAASSTGPQPLPSRMPAPTGSEPFAEQAGAADGTVA